MKLNKRGDKRGVAKMTEDHKKKLYKPTYTPKVIDYWTTTLTMVESRLIDYVNSPEVIEYVNTPHVGQPPTVSPEELVKRGIDYFKFAIQHNRNMTVYGLSLHTEIPTHVLMRMDQKDSSPYKNPFFKPIVRTFKNMIGMFHEEMGSDKINPNFHIFLLKAMKNGFEEQMDVNFNSEPRGLDEQERIDLRNKIKTFSEVYSKKRNK